MADIIDNQVAGAPTDQAKADLAQQMAISLGMGNVPPTPAVKEGQTGPVGTPTTAAQGVGAPSADGTAVVVPPPFSFDPFKEKFGYNTPEDALKEIAELRALKDKAPAIPEYEFENEDSKNLFEAFRAGKVSEVRDYLDRQHKIDKAIGLDVSAETAAEIVKLGMQIKYKDLTPAEIEYKFKKQFGTPAKPTQAEDEEDVAYQSRVSQWQDQVNDRQMELLIEAKLAKPEITAAKAKIVLPEIEQATDDDYLQYKQGLEEESKLAAETIAAYKAFTPKSIETKINFKDEANKIDFDFQFEPDQESFGKSIEMISDIQQFYKSFYNQDGTPDRKKFLDAVYFASNKDKIILEAIKQAKNATIKAMIPDNNTGGIVKQMPQSQADLSEFDKQMRQSLHGYGGF